MRASRPLARRIAAAAAALCLAASALLVGGCSLEEEAQAPAALATSAASTATRTVGGVKSISANARVYNSTTLIDSIIIEYDDDIVLPEEPIEGEDQFYRVEDKNATFGERTIQAVYTNDAAELRSDQTSVVGRFAVIEFAPVVPDPGSTLYWKIPTDATSVLVRRDDGVRLRSDYTGLTITQNFLAQTPEGATVRASGTLAELASTDIVWPQLANFSIDEVFMGSRGDLHYSYCLPKDYDPTRSYPLVVVLNDDMTNIGFTDKGTIEQASIGVNLVADTQVLGWTNQSEPVIVLAPQPTTNDDITVTLVSELINWFAGAHSVDTSRIYATGYDEGAQTMSQVVARNPELFAAYLHNTAAWDINGWPLVSGRVGIYLFCSVSEETVTSTYLRDIRDQLAAALTSEGFSDEQVSQLLWLKQPDDTYFERQGIASPHDGGRLAINDQAVVSWMLSQHKGLLEPENPVEEESDEESEE